MPNLIYGRSRAQPVRLTHLIVPLDLSPLSQILKALALAASEVLDRDPAPTLSLDELVARLQETGTVRVSPLDQLLSALGAYPEQVRLLRRPESEAGLRR